MDTKVDSMATVNNPAMNTRVYMPLQHTDSISFEYITQ
jgi:hypothetical protein